MEPDRRREPVCRSLFGPVDHDQLRRELTLRLQEVSEQDSRRWNFNFQTETPLPGRLQWEETPAGCAASFYQERTPRRDDDRPGSRDQENCPRISNTSCPAPETPARRKRGLKAAKPGRNTRITDYFTKRRRTEPRSILNQLLPSEGAQCKTIR